MQNQAIQLSWAVYVFMTVSVYWTAFTIGCTLLRYLSTGGKRYGSVMDGHCATACTQYWFHHFHWALTWLKAEVSGTTWLFCGTADGIVRPAWAVKTTFCSHELLDLQWNIQAEGWIVIWSLSFPRDSANLRLSYLRIWHFANISGSIYILFIFCVVNNWIWSSE